MHSLRNNSTSPPLGEGGGAAADGRTQTLEQDCTRHRAQEPVSSAGSANWTRAKTQTDTTSSVTLDDV